MSLVVRPKNYWATPEAWAAHKELISSLYWDEDKSLKAVQETMIQKHGFYATERMYKTRFKAWGLTKNLKTREVEQICIEAIRGRPRDPPAIRGRQIGSKRFKRYLDQVNMYATGMGPPPVFLSQGPSPLSSRLQPPDVLRFSEDCMHAVASYARQGLSTKSFHFDDVEYDYMGDYALTFWSHVTLASEIAQRATLSDAFRMLHKCFDDYVVVLEKGDPSLVWTSLMSVLVMADVGYDLARSFIRFAARLSVIKLGHQHPMTCLWMTLQSMGIPQIRQAASSVMAAHLAALATDNKLADEFRKVASMHTYRQLNRWGALSFASASAAYKKTIYEFSVSRDTQHSSQWYYWSLQRYSILLCENGKFAEALASLEPVKQYLHNGTPELEFDSFIGRDPVTALQYYELKGKILEGLGQMNEATAFFIANYELSRLVASDHVFRLTKSASDLEAHYRRKNDAEAAEKIRADFGSYWEILIDEKITWYDELPKCCPARHSRDHAEWCPRQSLPVKLERPAQ